MNVSGDAHRSRLPRRDASARLARLLDRAVVVFRAGQIFAFAGRIVVGVAVAIVAIGLGRGLGLRPPFPTGPIVVAAAIGIAAWRGSRRWTWPDRLATAMTLERAHPRIGERISRAVAFIGTPLEASAKDSPVLDLIGEALDDAATAFEEVARQRSGVRRVVNSPLFPLRWPAAGLAVVIAVAVAAFTVPGRLFPPLADAFCLPRSTRPMPPPGQPDSASGLPKAAVSVAIRLADAAATEDRLAAALFVRFAASPGVIREDLPLVEKEWLDEIASLQATVADDIGRDLATVVGAVEGADPSLAAELAGGVVHDRTARLAAAAERIRGNQLAIASGLITSQVRPILAALRGRGVVPSGKTGPAFDRAELVQRRIVSAIEVDEQRLSGAVDTSGRGPAGGEIDLAHVDGAGRVPAPSTVAVAPGDRQGAAAGGTTGDAGGPGAGGEVEAAEGANVVPDAIRLLPAWVRAREERSAETLLGDEFAAPPRYREAVNDYFRRLWVAESTEQPSVSAQEAPP